jgi:hypothetical protein
VGPDCVASTEGEGWQSSVTVVHIQLGRRSAEM